MPRDYERFEIRLDHLYDDFPSGRIGIKLKEPIGFIYYISRGSGLHPEDRKKLLSEIIDRFKEDVLSHENS